MSNHLRGQTSPYLLQHADNPVDWYPWGREALQKAKIEDKPIFLRIGYSTCHWCHVMARESFEDLEIARLLNESFVSIKVDREERPDIDSLYMAACQAFTGSGGWPTTLFLTPEQLPFFAGTYSSHQPGRPDRTAAAPVCHPGRLGSGPGGPHRPGAAVSSAAYPETSGAKFPHPVPFGGGRGPVETDL